MYLTGTVTKRAAPTHQREPHVSYVPANRWVDCNKPLSSKKLHRHGSSALGRHSLKHQWQHLWEI